MLSVREECEVLSVGKENENARITTHDPVMGVTNWGLEEEELQVLCSITISTINYNMLHCNTLPYKGVTLSAIHLWPNI